LASYNRGVHKVFLHSLQGIIKKFRIRGNWSYLQDAVVLIQDLIDIKQQPLEEAISSRRKAALFLPHVAKFMDGRCKAVFDTSIPATFARIAARL